MEDEKFTLNRIKSEKEEEPPIQESKKEDLNATLTLTNQLRSNVLTYRTDLLTLREKYIEFIGAEIELIFAKIDAAKIGDGSEGGKKTEIIKALVYCEEKLKSLEIFADTLTFDTTPLKILNEQNNISTNMFDSLSLPQLLENCEKFEDMLHEKIKQMTKHIKQKHLDKLNEANSISQEQSTFLSQQTEDEAVIISISAAEFWDTQKKSCREKISILGEHIKAISPSSRKQLPQPKFLLMPKPIMDKRTALLRESGRRYGDYDPEQRVSLANNNAENFGESFARVYSRLVTLGIKTGDQIGEAIKSGLFQDVLQAKDVAPKQETIENISNANNSATVVVNSESESSQSLENSENTTADSSSSLPKKSM